MAKGEKKEAKEVKEEKAETKKNIFEDVLDETDKFDKKDIESGKGMAVLSYIGILCLIPYFAEKNNPYVVYHAKQGLNLFLLEVIASVAVSVLSVVLFLLFFIVGLVGFAVGVTGFALSIMGIINVCNGKAKELPIVNKIKLIK